mmetsp:Transcript_3255/g.5982  ORF Transcript_3255/g.5982 Transcript_3255/m.5982 type:complete len:831 (-) Transcript_3255:218-2710(-)
MWGSLGDRLAGLGDAITNQASAHAKIQHEQEGQKDASAEATTEGTVVEMPPPPAEAADKTADAANENQPLPRWASSFAASVSDKQNQQAVLGSFRNWSNTIVESTKNIVNETQKTLEKEQARIQANAPSLFSKGGPYTRDPSLPLDVEALRDAEVVYITDRIVTLSHPYMQSTSDGDITPDRKLAAVGHLLQKRHGGKYMVWNLSEVEYDASVLDDQVLVYKFPGSPSPPLGLLLKLLMAMESWLKADERNVAVIHCLTGRGRTSTVLAAFLCWTGEAGFTDVNSALEYIAQCKRISVQSLTIPSQVRYVSYFANMLDGVRPSQPPLMLKRIIMNSAPTFGKRPAPPSGDGSDENAPGETLFGCAPYLQIFKAGNLVFTTAASVNYAQTKDDLPFCTTNDGPVSFLTEAVVQGDILLRCRHLTKSGQRVSMFRCAFHTGYVPPKVLRLTKAQLDGACGDKRFADDFFLDLIFEPCDEATASKHLMNNPEKASGELGEGDGGEGGANEAAERRSLATAGSASNTVSASAYDTMLHRDSRFWDVIGKRREENRKKQAELEKKGGEEKDAEAKEDENTPISGPTIGRRRDFDSKQTTSGSTDEKAGSEGAGGSSATATSQQDRMSAFSIGEEFGLDAPSKPAADPGSASKPLEIPSSPRPKEKDALMEALMDLDDDGLDDEEGEIVFESGDGESPAEEAAVLEVPSLPIQPTAAVVEANSGDNIAQSDDDDAAVTSVASPTDQKAATGSDANDITLENEIPGVPAKENSEEESEVDTDLLPDIAGLGDDLADLDVGDTGEDFDDAGEFDDFDDFEDDAELEDLENFLTKVSTK